MRPVSFLVLLAAPLLAAAGISGALAADVMVVMDGSGSAAGRIGGTPKIDIARNALAAELDRAPGDLRLGLVAYGHRQKGQCGDIELLSTPLPDNIGAFLAAARQVRPLGNSPITAAAIAAAEAMGADADGTVILFTDGADNCEPDPCAAVSAFHERMPGVRISIVGIGIPEEDAAGIACIADITGGLYLRAANDRELRTNLAEALDEAWAGEPAPPPPQANLTAPDGVEQGLPFAVSYTGPLAKGDEVRISWAGTAPDQHITGAFISADGKPVTLTAPEERGRYELRYWNPGSGKVIATRPLRVVAVSPSLDAPDSVVQGQAFEIGWRAPQIGDLSVQVAEPGTPVGRAIISTPAARGTRTARLDAPGQAGSYELRLYHGGDVPEVLATRPITVAAAVVRLAPEGPVVAGSRFTLAWEGPGAPTDEIRLAAPGMDADRYLSVARLGAPGESVSLEAPYPGGSYELRYWSAGAASVLATQALTVQQPTAALTAPDSVAAGATISIGWTGPGELEDRIVLVAGDGPAEPAFTRGVTLDGGPVSMPAPAAAGQYALRYLGGPDRIVLAERPITVTAPAASIAVDGSVSPGQPFSVRWDGPAARFDEIRVTAPSDSETLAAARLGEPASPVTLTAPSRPGVYLVRYWSAASGVALASAPLTVAGLPPAEAVPGGAPPANLPLRP